MTIRSCCARCRNGWVDDKVFASVQRETETKSNTVLLVNTNGHQMQQYLIAVVLASANGRFLLRTWTINPKSSHSGVEHRLLDLVAWVFQRRTARQRSSMQTSVDG